MSRFPQRVYREGDEPDPRFSLANERTISFSPTGGDFVVGRVVGWNIDESVMRDGRIDTELLRPLGRLAGPRYTTLGTVIELPPVPGG